MMTALRQDQGPTVRGAWREHEPMARHTTWRCGGPARAYFEPADRDDLAGLCAQLDDDAEILWLGLGSNMLVRDGGIDAIVIATAPGLGQFTWLGDDRLYAEAGVPCARLARAAARQDRAGLEFLAGIPGTLGGALRMNAGALGAETWDFVESVETVHRSGAIRRHAAVDYRPGYRSVTGPSLDFVAATLYLPETAGGRGNDVIREVLAKRSATQPTGQASCGSVFTNPDGDFAGRLIEQCGLKGRRIGGAEVSAIHANFIVNSGNATAADIEALIDDVRQTVLDQTGISLSPEVCIVGHAAPGSER